MAVLKLRGDTLSPPSLLSYKAGVIPRLDKAVGGTVWSPTAHGKQAECRRDQHRLFAPTPTQRADTGISLECCAELCDTASEGTQLSLQQTGTDHSEGPQVTNVGSENSEEPSLQSNSGKTPQMKNTGANKIRQNQRASLEGRDYQRK